MGSVVIKQGERILLSSSSPHQMTNTINKSLSLSMTPQQTIMGLCDNNSSSYRETTTKLVSSRKSIISNFTTNRFVELPDKPDNELNLIYCQENFTSENATINSLPVVILIHYHFASLANWYAYIDYPCRATSETMGHI